MQDTPSINKTRTAYRICPVCEATCGLRFDIDADDKIVAIRGNDGDVLSQGYICPKGVAVRELHEDPDRLRQPLIRRGGNLEPASWEEAFAEIEKRLLPIREEFGPQAVGIYLGNPTAHKAGLSLAVPALIRSIGTSNIFSASTLDQMPKQVACGLMYGHPGAIAVPDIDRTDFLLILGGNPMVSNGSLWTVPDYRGRARKLRDRGGRIIVVDPKRTETAKQADQHIPISPGTDVFLLLALANTLFAENLVNLKHLESHVENLEQIEDIVAPYTPESVSTATDIAAIEIRQLARDLAAADKAAVYGRIGTSVTEFGTTASWLVDVLNILTGNLDRPGGVMWASPAAFGITKRRGGSKFRIGRRHSRVSHAPEVMGEYPAVCLAEEIETPGEGQIRALVTVAGNPALSAPNGARLSRAFDQLDFMVSLDIYLNETTRHADVVLPGASPLEEFHFPMNFQRLSARNSLRFSPALFSPSEDQLEEWEIASRIAHIMAGQNNSEIVQQVDDKNMLKRIETLTVPGAALEGKDPQKILAALEPRHGPERQIDFAIRMGPEGDKFGLEPDGLTLDKLVNNPNGVDLGALRECLEEIVGTPSGKIEMAPEPIVQDLPRVSGALEEIASRVSGDSGAATLTMIGRRNVRTNNSWMHNLPLLAKGKFKGALQVHPSDAHNRTLEDGDIARLSNDRGSLEVVIELSEDMKPGVVCLPHGFGHVFDDTNLRVASNQPGVNSNQLADDGKYDPLSGTAVLNGIPVSLAAL